MGINDLKNAVTERKNKGFEIDETMLAFNDEIFSSEYGEFLKESSIKYIKIGSKANLAVGKICQDVFDKTGTKRHGTYEAWIKFMGIDKRAALRARKFYELFISVNEDKQKLVALLPLTFVEKIMKDKIEAIAYINTCNTVESIKSISLPLESRSLDTPHNYAIDFDFGVFKNINKKIEKLDLKKQEVLKEKCSLLLNEIQAILES